MNPPSAARRVLIIRLSAIGDVVMASALIPALRQHWPDAHLAWLVEPPARDLLRHNPRLDEVIVWPKAAWRTLWRERRFGELWREARRFAADLRARRFDLVLDTQGLLKSAAWAAVSGARERIGLGSREGGQLLMTRVIPRRGESRRIGAEYLRLAEDLGLVTGSFPMDIAIAADEAERARLRLRDRGIRSPYAVLCPFTTRPQKHWFEDRWSALAGELSRRTGMPAVLLGGPGDVGAATRVAAASTLVNLVGRTSLGETAALIGDASLLIGVDTGLTHLGIALNVPTVALFGSTRPYLDPAVPKVTILYADLPCAPCRRHPTCNNEFTCMRRLTVDGVLTAALRLLGPAA